MHTFSAISLAAALACCTPIALADAPPTPRPVTGTVVMARSANGSTLFIWEATPFVAQLVTDKLLGDDGLHALEATAILALAEKAKKASTPAVVLRVTYARTGAVSPVYGTPTFEGVERVVTLSAQRATLEKNADAWSSAFATGATPRGVTVEVTGKLPPPQ